MAETVRTLTYRVRLQSGDLRRIETDLRRTFERAFRGRMNLSANVVGRGGGGGGGGFIGGGGINTLGLSAMGRYGLGGVLGRALRTGAIAGGIGLVTSEVIQLGSELGNLYHTIQNVSDALIAMSDNTADAENRIQAVIRASGGASDRLEAMRIAALGASLGYADSAEALERMVTVARKASIAMGLTIPQAIDQMTRASANLAFRRLDELGINATKTRRIFNELRGTMDDSMAFMEAMLRVGEETFQGFEVVPSNIDRIKASLKDLKIILAETFGPTTDAMMDRFADSLENVARAAREYREWSTSSTRDLEYQLDLVNTAIENLQREIDMDMAAGGQPRQEFLDQLKRLQIEAEYLRQKIEEVNKAEMGGPTEEAKRMEEHLARAKVQALQLRVALGLVGEEQEKLVTNRQMMLLGAPEPMFAGQESGISIFDIIAQKRQEETEAFQDEMRRRIKEAYREQKQEMEKAARAAEAAWEKAARDAASAFENAIRSVPGLFGTSEVTQEQLDQAAAGVPQNFADDFLRRLRDQVINGVDWGIDVQEVARQAGIDPNLPQEIITQIFSNMWETGELFANPENIDRFINWDAVRANLEQQQRQQMGQENLQQAALQRFGEMFNLDQFGNLMADRMKTAVQNAAIADPVVSEVQKQFSSEATTNRVAVVGEKMVNVIFKQFEESALAKQWAQSIINAVNAALAEYMDGLTE